MSSASSVKKCSNGQTGASSIKVKKQIDFKIELRLPWMRSEERLHRPPSGADDLRRIPLRHDVPRRIIIDVRNKSHTRRAQQKTVRSSRDHCAHTVTQSIILFSVLIRPAADVRRTRETDRPTEKTSSRTFCLSISSVAASSRP